MLSAMTVEGVPLRHCEECNDEAIHLNVDSPRVRHGAGCRLTLFAANDGKALCDPRARPRIQ